MVFSCVLRKLDDDDDREELAEANAHPEKDEEAIAKEEDPVLMLGESLKAVININTVVIYLFLKFGQIISLVNKLIYLKVCLHISRPSLSPSKLTLR